MKTLWRAPEDQQLYNWRWVILIDKLLNILISELTLPSNGLHFYLHNHSIHFWTLPSFCSTRSKQTSKSKVFPIPSKKRKKETSSVMCALYAKALKFMSKTVDCVICVFDSLNQPNSQSASPKWKPWSLIPLRTERQIANRRFNGI